ncbi:ABC transporter substrate-binding protein [Paenibacillus xanthanilyticus]|uniref:ABC transporter substrate-binding protein n=1 Tax=Paenibacillus xanthanilyticus TaxID=1783531 RepID=A0ABV8K6H9_9BACL
MKRTKQRTSLLLGFALLAGLAAAFGIKGASESFSAYSPIPAAAKELAATSSEAPVELRILAVISPEEWLIAEYERLYPDRKIVWEQAAIGEDFIHKLAADPAPDIIIAENAQANDLVAFDLFEDLGQAPYKAAERIQNDWFNGLTLSPFRSLDGQSLIAIPKDYPMMGTFYRADILAQYGFPAEPEALATFMEDPANWLRMAKTLQAAGHSIMTNGTDILNLGAAGKGFFTPQGGYARNTPDLIPIASVMLEAEQAQLPSFLNMWDELGQQAIRDEKLIMLYMGEWGGDLLKEWDPEHADQWAFTRLPFNAYAVHGGTYYAILEASANKKAAWDYIRLSLEQETNYRENRPGWKWMAEMNDYWPSPLAGTAEEIWYKHMYEPRPAGLTATQLLSAIKARTMEKLGGELQVLREVVQTHGE